MHHLITGTSRTIRRSLSRRSTLIAIGTSGVVFISTTTRLEGSKNEKDSEKKETVFDLLRSENFNSQDFWGKIVSKDASKGIMGEKSKQEDAPKGSKNVLSSMASDFMGLLSGNKESSMDSLITKARESTEQGEVQDTTSLGEIIGMLEQYKGKLEKVAERYMGDLDFSNLAPTALAYYLEYEDERKNPSWKRRAHRFCSGINIAKVTELNSALSLAELVYADTAEEISKGLENHTEPCELVFSEIRSEPGKPANFVALKKDQSGWSSSLEVIMCVRGTKTVADALTDLLCDEEDYRGGTAHGFILQSGKYLAQQHAKLFEELLENSGKSKIKLTIIGHSLGAGVASIAGIELNDNEKIDVSVIGFGCPALLSKDLAEKYDFITTVVNDNDIVPRMSGVSVANLLLNIMEFNWVPYAKRDLHDAVNELQKRQPIIFNKTLTDNIYQFLEPKMEEYMESTIKKDKTEKVEPVLYPPGKCIHFYFDGSGYSANIVPNDFFGEIDVSRRMIDDHLFHSGYTKSLLEVMRQHKGDHHFKFDDDNDEK